MSKLKNRVNRIEEKAGRGWRRIVTIGTPENYEFPSQENIKKCKYFLEYIKGEEKKESLKLPCDKCNKGCSEYVEGLETFYYITMVNVETGGIMGGLIGISEDVMLKFKTMKEGHNTGT